MTDKLKQAFEILGSIKPLMVLSDIQNVLTELKLDNDAKCRIGEVLNHTLHENVHKHINNSYSLIKEILDDINN